MGSVVHIERAFSQVPCGVLKPCVCNDGVDNDNDGVQDATGLRPDPGCTSTIDPSEYDESPDANGNLTPEPDFYPPASTKLLGFNTFLNLWDGRVSPEAERVQIQAVGGRAQRVPIAWYPSQPNSAAEWIDGGLDKARAIAAELTSHGSTPVFAALDAPNWANDWASCALTDTKCIAKRQKQQSLAPPNDDNIGTYANFVRRMAAISPSIAVETWNEPNIPVFWNAKVFPNPARMAAMQCAAYDAVKAATPGQLVLSPGFAWPGDAAAPYSSFVRVMYEQMGRTCWDVLSVHFYSGTRTIGPDSMTALALRTVRTLQGQYADTSPIWVTETGSTTTGSHGEDHGFTKRTEAQQCTIVREMVNELMATSDVRAVFIHTLREHPNPETNSGANPLSAEYGFGLQKDGVGSAAFGSPKVAWTHFKSVAEGSPGGC